MISIIFEILTAVKMCVMVFRFMAYCIIVGKHQSFLRNWCSQYSTLKMDSAVCCNPAYVKVRVPIKYSDVHFLSAVGEPSHYDVITVKYKWKWLYLVLDEWLI